LRRRDLTDVYLNSDDLRSSIKLAAVHALHEVDWHEAPRRAQSNKAIGPAWDAYWKHRALASRLGHIFKVVAAKRGEKAGLEELIEELTFIAQIDDRSEATRLAEWLLQENARIGEDDARSNIKPSIVRGSSGE
jgi:hypothetical protein